MWRRRSAHRAAGVAAIKRSKEYTVAADPRAPRPTTPDPTDRRLTKRRWERGNQRWRFDLKTLKETLERQELVLRELVRQQMKQQQQELERLLVELLQLHVGP